MKWCLSPGMDISFGMQGSKKVKLLSVGRIQLREIETNTCILSVGDISNSPSSLASLSPDTSIGSREDIGSRDDELSRDVMSSHADTRSAFRITITKDEGYKTDVSVKTFVSLIVIYNISINFC